jgi:hypothetical protein
MAQMGNDDAFVRFCSKDPTCKLPFKGFDRFNIPATADTLVSDGIGLQIFLKAGKASQRLPKQSVGDRTDPSIISYGRAIEMFGVPDGPGEDWRQAGEPSTEPVASLREELAQVDITKTTPKPEQQEARTEYDYRRLRDWQPQTTPLLSEEQQWVLFGSKKHISDAAILARQYTKLVAEKLAGDTTTNSGWPLVEQLDWAGFTNWIHRCKSVDKAFGRATLPSWNKEREQRRATVVAKLKAWVPPQGFDDGSSSHQPPTQFYTGEPLCFSDAKRLGFKNLSITKH